jgi:hypothetical protein
MSKLARRILRRRPVLGVTFAAIAFTTVFAFAASLTVGSETLGAGNTTVAACDTDGVDATYATTYDTTLGYKVTSVTLANVGVDAGLTNGACAGKAVKVQLTGTGNSALEEKTATLANPGTGSATLTGFNTSASSVTGIHVVISG